MKTLILAILISMTSQAHAGDLIILDNYHLEKIEREPSNLEHESERVSDTRGHDTQVEGNRRDINDYTIKRNKKNRKYNHTKDNSPFLEYKF